MNYELIKVLEFITVTISVMIATSMILSPILQKIEFKRKNTSIILLLGILATIVAMADSLDVFLKTVLLTTDGIIAGIFVALNDKETATKLNKTQKIFICLACLFLYIAMIVSRIGEA